MSDACDKFEQQLYTRLLQIPVDACPPDYFQLLALSSDCQDAAAIDAAAQRQATKLRQKLPAPYQLAARKILRRIEKAQTCLLDARARQAYVERITPTKTGFEEEGAFPIDEETFAVDDPDFAALGLRRLELSALSDTVEAECSVPLQAFSREATPPPKITVDWRRLIPAIGTLAALIIVAAVWALRTAAETPDEGREIALPPAGPAAAAVAPPSSKRVQPQAPETTRAPTTTTSRSAKSAPQRHAPAPPPQATPLATHGETSPRSPRIPHNVRGWPAVPPPSPIIGKSGSSVPTEGSIGSQVNASASTLQGGVELPAAARAAPTATPVAPASSSLTPNSATALTSFPSEVQLPIERPVAAEAQRDPASAAIDLGTLDAQVAARLDVGLAEPRIRKFQRTKFVVVPPSSRSVAELVWEIRLVAESQHLTPLRTGLVEGGPSTAPSALDDTQTGFDELVATVRVVGGKVHLRWEGPQRLNYAAQLQNCLLLLSAAGASHAIQLRNVQRLPSFVTDLTDRNRVLEVEGDDLPALDAVQLRLERIQLPGVDFQAEPDAAVVNHGQTLRLLLAGTACPAELQFSLLGSQERPKVRFTPKYRLTTKWSPLTPEDMGSAIAGIERLLVEGARELAAAERAASDLPRRIAANAARHDHTNTAAVNAVANNLERQLRSAEGTIRRMRRSVPEMEENLAILRELAATAGRFHQQGHVDLHVVVPCSQGELVLMSTAPLGGQAL